MESARRPNGQAEHGIKNGKAETDQQAHFGVGDSEVAANRGDE